MMDIAIISLRNANTKICNLLPWLLVILLKVVVMAKMMAKVSILVLVFVISSHIQGLQTIPMLLFTGICRHKICL
ncbi:MAG: hypothetical protein CMK92_05625 [Pseudomonas sp.]|nr:hypothetical protein [Pseudomonas sp.]